MADGFGCRGSKKLGGVRGYPSGSVWAELGCVTLGALAMVSGCGSESALRPEQDGPESTESPAVDAGDERVLDDLGRALGGGRSSRPEQVVLFTAPEQMFCIDGICTEGIPADLAFNPSRPGELWVVFRQPTPVGLCEQNGDRSGCPYLYGKVAIISDAGNDEPTVEVKEDGNSWHFMRQTTSIAFGEDDTFATIGEDRTANPHDAPADYMGPTLWSSDPEVFAVDFGRNGSHLDMLHASPYGMGIAHQKDHVYFVFNGQSGAIDAYDFKAPHEPGGEDHSDGTLLRYVEGEVKRRPNVPSHMEFMPDGETLLIADTGNERVVALETTSGRLAERLTIDDGQIADPRRIAGATLREIVPAGVLEEPSGLVVGQDSFAVGDAATGRIHRYGFDGEASFVLDLDIPSGALGGLALGPDGSLYFTRKDQNTVVRLKFE